MFSHWRTSSESAIMAAGLSDTDLDQARVGPRAAVASRTSSPIPGSSVRAVRAQNRPTRHSLHTPIYTNSSLLYVTHNSSGTATSRPRHQEAEAVHSQASSTSSDSGAKLWQSLVLPMVLACVIFLMALWTRQISLVLTNGTIMMIVIMASIFIVLSAIAFWLSCDQFFQKRSPDESPEVSSAHSGLEEQGAHHSRDLESTADQPHHCHHANCQLAAAQRLGSQGALTSPPRAVKCCHISVIDCQPPDYHSALLNSVPFHQYLMFNHEDDELNSRHSNEDLATLQVINFDGDSIRNSDEEQELEGGQKTCEASCEAAKHLYLFPPSYEELTKK